MLEEKGLKQKTLQIIPAEDGFFLEGTGSFTSIA
jgi:hypothetical protein